jgi:hypothetical protein
MAIGLPAQLLADGQSIQARQAEVQHQHVRRAFQRHLQRQAPVAGLLDLPAGAAEHRHDLRAQGGVILDDEEAGCGTGRGDGHGGAGAESRAGPVKPTSSAREPAASGR